MPNMFHPFSQQDRQINFFLIAACLFCCAVGLTYALCCVPMNMDEAGIFHVLACLDHPFAEYNIFREPCYVKNDLTLWGGFYLLRAQFYTGLTHALLYLPFYKLFHAQYGQYIFAFVFLAGFITLFARQTKNFWLGFAIAAAFFPLTFQTLHDTGPVKSVLLLYPLCALLFAQLLKQSSPLRYGIAVVLGLLCFAATEEKAFFLYLLPSILFYALAYSSESRSFGKLAANLHKAWPALAVFTVVFLTLVLFLLSGTNANGFSYFNWLVALSGNNKLSFGEWSTTYVSFQLFWPMFAHYHFDLEQSVSSGFVLKFATLGFLFTVGAVSWRYRLTVLDNKPRNLFLLLSYLSLVIVFALMRNTWAGHHFIFMWIPALFFFATMLEKIPAGWRMALVGIFLCLNVWSLLVLTQNKLHVKVNHEKEAIYAYLNDPERAANSIYNFSTWGGYFIQAMYGPKTQIAVYSEPYEAEPALALYPAYAEKMMEIARFTGRKLYTICYQPGLCSKAALEDAFGHKMTFEEVLPGLEHWKLFAGEDKQALAKTPSESPKPR
jgi:hypothetical protein